MEGADALGLIAEIGIAIAGFAGVIAALRAPGGKMKPYTAVRISILLCFSVAAVVLGLLPFAFGFAGLSSPAIWVLSSTAMILLIGTLQIVFARLFYSVTKPALPEDSAPGELLVTVVSTALLLGLIGLQIANVALFRQLWPFYVGLLGLMIFSLYQFAYILFAPSQSEVPA